MLEQSVLDDCAPVRVECRERFADEQSQLVGGKRGERIPQAFGPACVYRGPAVSFEASHVVTLPQTIERLQERGPSRNVACDLRPRLQISWCRGARAAR